MAQANRIGSFVFFDLETTGLPYQENNRTKITELAMVAVNRDHILSSELGYLPRVLQKLVLCFFTSRIISDTVTRVTGLSNISLQNERKFDKGTVDMISGFLDRQQKPVCFVVHNGNRFDYPILRAEIDDLQMKLADHVMCIDSLSMFRQFYKKKPAPKEKFGRLYINRLDWEALDNLEKALSDNNKPMVEFHSNALQDDIDDDQISFDLMPEGIICSGNDNTMIGNNTNDKDLYLNVQNNSEQEITMEDKILFDSMPEETFVSRSENTMIINNENKTANKQNNLSIVNGISQELDLLHSYLIPGKNATVKPPEQPNNASTANTKSTSVQNDKLSFKLGEIYQRLLGKPPTGAHHAEGDCLILLECCIAESKRFVEYCDNNSIAFSSIPRMEPKIFTTACAIKKKRPAKQLSRAQKLS